MDYELLKVFITGGLFWTISKVSIAYINRKQKNEITYKNEHCELHIKGESIYEAEKLFKKLPKILIKELENRF